MTLPIRIWAATLLLAVALTGLVIRETQARAAGREVRLPMQAVDPRNILSGHYVDLQLTQVLEAGKSCPPGAEASRNVAGWIAVTPAPDRDHITGFAATRADAARLGPVVMKGKLYCWSVEAGEGRDGGMTLDVGVRRFHADQKQAEALARALADRKVGDPADYAIVSVGSDGRPRLKGVIVGGRRADLTWN